MNNNKIRIAIVEDDPNQMDYIIRCLADDYEVMPCEDAISFMRLSAQQAPELLILDWILPGISGVELMTRLRLQGNQIPTIIVSARCDEDSLVEALEAGANDFMVKPVRPRELNARIRALSRGGVVAMAAKPYSLGAYRVDFQSRALFINDKEVRLTNREFELATILLRRPGELLHRDTLLRVLWGLDEGISTRTLDIHISRLRKKLGLNGDFGFQLRSVYQLGYRLEQQG